MGTLAMSAAMAPGTGSMQDWTGKGPTHSTDGSFPQRASWWQARRSSRSRREFGLRCAEGETSSAVIVPRLHRSGRHPDEDADYIDPSEGWLVVQVALLVVVSSWDCGGMSSTAMNWVAGGVLLGLPILVARRREGHARTWWPFIPSLLWIVFVLMALCNPSHVATSAGWIPRVDWISWLPTTIDRQHTIEDIRLWLPALFEAGLIAASLRTARAARMIWTVVAVNGFVLAAVGAVFHFAGIQQVLGIIDPPEPTYFFATFFYKNHWAAYGALAALAGIMLALKASRNTFAADPRARGPFLLFGCIGTLTVVTLPLPGSRAGALLAATLISAFIVQLICDSHGAHKARAGRSAAIPLMLIVTIAVAGYGTSAYFRHATVDVARTTRELKQGIDGEQSDLRLLVARDTWHMASARPFFGWGPGCFEIVFPIYQGAYLRSPDGRATARFEFAHNDWLQTLAEDGIIGSLVLIVPLLVMTRKAWTASDHLGRLAIAGCGLIALHACIDFPLHNPAVLMLWVIMLASVARLSPAAPFDQRHDRRTGRPSGV
ncbi:MAG TPA: O-antigen ligase family protein [Opitutaceae bacterium]|nr:O-antigen ligase family protein [Opitutaceae bacterium]